MEQNQIEKHSTIQSVILHLLPGILVGSFYFLARQPIAVMGYPSIFALQLAFAFVSDGGHFSAWTGYPFHGLPDPDDGQFDFVHLALQQHPTEPLVSAPASLVIYLRCPGVVFRGNPFSSL
jgi:hypothetical protein